MTTRAMDLATLGTAIGVGLSGGVFVAFSTFVMPGLGRLPARESLGAMQAINRSAVTPGFMTLLMGSAAACVLVLVLALRDRGAPASPWAIAGAAVFLVGVLGVTAAKNVPLNDALEALGPHPADAAARWEAFASSWNGWNHVRSVAGVVSTGLLVAAVRVG